MKIILLGYMGSGKTGVGRFLAEKLKWPFLDLDQEIERKEERDIPEIFRNSGEIYFRKMESQTLQQILEAGPEDLILSVGGGTPCYGNNLQLMRSQPGVTSIYLKTSLETLTKRLFEEKDSRPLIEHLASEELLNDFIRKHLFERAFFYNQGDISVITDDRSLVEVAEVIATKLSLQ